MGRRSDYPAGHRLRAAQLVLDSRRHVREVVGELGIVAPSQAGPSDRPPTPVA